MIENEQILHALVIALIVLAINSCFWEGMIFGKIGSALESWNHKIWKPTVGCAICMVPWVGSLFLLIIYEYFDPFVILIAMGMNVVFSSLWKE